MMSSQNELLTNKNSTTITVKKICDGGAIKLSISVVIMIGHES